MLKRKGEVCRHKVPGYPGLLTDSEHEIYVEIVEYVKEDLSFINNCQRIFNEFEEQLPRLRKLVDNVALPNLPTITLLNRDDTWQILDTFYKKEGFGELLFCSRLAKDGREFSVLKKFYAESNQVIELFGKKIDIFYLANGKDPSRVLEQFLDNELYSIEMRKKEMELKIIKDVFKRHPADICRRVCKAVAPLFDEHAMTEIENISSVETASNMKMKL